MGSILGPTWVCHLSHRWRALLQVSLLVEEALQSPWWVFRWFLSLNIRPQCLSRSTLLTKVSYCQIACRKPADGASSSNCVTDISHLVRKKVNLYVVISFLSSSHSAFFFPSNDT